jgi:CheY-like chemotaxis protein
MPPDQRTTVLRHPVLLMVPLHHTTSRVIQALRATGFETRILDAVPEVLDAARARTLAAIVLDVSLAGPDPRAFLDELRRVAPQLPVIALTSREQREQIVSLLRGCQDDYLTTPFPVEELVSRLRLRVQDQLSVDRTVLRAGVVTVDTALGLVSVTHRIRPAGRVGWRSGPAGVAGPVGRRGLGAAQIFERRGGLRRVPAPQAGCRPDPHGARCRLRARRLMPPVLDPWAA